MDAIFLSYRGLEAEFALKLAADLKNAGVRVWVDRLDGIVAGDDWRAAIESALNTCAAMIPVLSPGYVRSAYCRNELARADDLKRPVFPVLLQAVSPTDWPLEVQRVQYEDFTRWRDEEQYTARFGALVRRLKTEAGDQVGPPPDEETRYLTSLVAAMEAKRGVMQYVELDADAEALARGRPPAPAEDEWGFVWLSAQASPGATDGAAAPAAGRTERLAGVAEAVERFPRFVLLGEPGAGKSTALRRLVRDAALRRLRNPHAEPLPLLIELPTWKEEPGPAELVRSRWVLPGDPVAALRTGDIWLVLDGLNEMADVQRRTGQLRQWLASPEGPARVAFASRTGAYVSEELRLGSLPTVELKQLQENQVRAVAASYLGGRAGAFLAQIMPGPSGSHGGAGLMLLARNPYLLSALIIVFEQSAGGTLPGNTGTLFRGLARALWEREGKRGAPGWVPYSAAEPAFASLAFAMVDEQRGTAVPQAYAAEKLGGSALLLAGISASYLARDGESGTVRFYHQLLQEYFAAVRLREVGVDSRLAAPSYSYIPGGVRDIDPLTYRSRAGTRWDEVVVALCGIVDEPDGLISRVLTRDPALAARCVASGVLLDSATRRKTLDRLLQALRGDDWRVVAAVAHALQRLNDPSVVPTLAAMLDGSLRGASYVVDVREAAALVLGALGGPEAVRALRAALNSPSPAVRARAAQALGRIGDPAAVPDLAFHLGDAEGTTPGNLYYGTTPQRESAHALAAMAARSPAAVLPAVLDALRSPHGPTRAQAAEVLGSIGDPGAVQGLLDALTYDVDYQVRRAAAAALGQIDDPRVVPALLARLGDPSSDVSEVASNALGKMGGRALAGLVEALGAPDGRVRARAARALGHAGGAAAVPALEPLVNDADVNVSRAAAEAIRRIQGAAVKA